VLDRVGRRLSAGTVVVMGGLLVEARIARDDSSWLRPG
jgi:hypothetical protein